MRPTGGLPASACRTDSTSITAVACCASSVEPAACGVRTTFLRPLKRSSSGGSCRRTSRPGAGDRALLQCLEERVFVDEHAARGVDDHGRGLHQRQPRGVDQPVVLGIARRVDRQVVAARKQLFERADKLDVPALAKLQVRYWLVGEHGHLETARALGDALADAAKPHDPERFAPHVARDRPRPRVAARHGVQFDDTARDRQHQAHGQVGDGPVVGALGGGDHDTVVGRGGHVDGADAPTGDVLERVGAFEDGAGVALGRGSDDDVVALDELDHLFFVGSATGPAVVTDCPARLTERSEARVVGADDTGSSDQQALHGPSIAAPRLYTLTRIL